MSDTSTPSSNPLLVAATWLVVVVPTLWGLSYTVKNAAKLFTHTAAPAAAPANPGPATPAR